MRTELAWLDISRVYLVAIRLPRCFCLASHSGGGGNRLGLRSNCSKLRTCVFFDRRQASVLRAESNNSTDSRLWRFMCAAVCWWSKNRAPRASGSFAVYAAGVLSALYFAAGERHGFKNALVAHFRLLVGLLDRGLALCRLSCFILGVRMTHHSSIIPRLLAVVIAQTAYVCREFGANLASLSQIETLPKGGLAEGGSGNQERRLAGLAQGIGWLRWG